MDKSKHAAKIQCTVCLEDFQVSLKQTLLGVPSYTKSAVFLNIVQKAVDPPLVLNIAEQFFFDGFHKKCVNVCRDKI